MFLITHRKIYELKFGIKGLILLREFPNLTETKNLEFLVYCGLVSQYPMITFQEVHEIIEEVQLRSLEGLPDPLGMYEVQELYIKAVGEIGMPPEDFYAATPEEINLAYEGYLRRKETEANLTKIAIISSEDNQLIRLTENKGYSFGNLQERTEIFNKLNLKERD